MFLLWCKSWKIRLTVYYVVSSDITHGGKWGHPTHRWHNNVYLSWCVVSSPVNHTSLRRLRAKYVIRVLRHGILLNKWHLRILRHSKSIYGPRGNTLLLGLEWLRSHQYKIHDTLYIHTVSRYIFVISGRVGMKVWLYCCFILILYVILC